MLAPFRNVTCGRAIRCLNGEAAQLQLNLGTVIDFTERHHLLLSAGPSFGTSQKEQAYLAYQLTI